MDPKFLVIEIDSKEQAVQLVQVMLDKGFARLMLLDDLSKHPTLGRTNPAPSSSIRNENFTEIATSATPKKVVTVDSSPHREQKVLFPSLAPSSSLSKSSGIKRELVNSTSLEDERAVEEEEEEEDIKLLNNANKRAMKRVYEQDPDDPDYREQLMSMLRGQPEIVPIEVNSAADEPTVSTSDSPTPKQKVIGEYHTCKLCGVRVKTPRSGRWNLQMHVIALHCVGRQYRCRECDYLDYRKSTMRKHCISQHGGDIPPHNIQDAAMKREWHEAMQKCFPEFAHRTGFLY